MLRVKTIRMKLFMTYSLLLVFALSSLAFYFYADIAGDLRERSSESIYQSAKYVSTQLDSEFRGMDVTAVKVIYADAIKDLFLNQLDPADRSTIFPTQRKINEAIYSIMGPLPLDWQINLFDLNGRFIGIGNNSYSTFLPREKMAAIAWARAVSEGEGERVISAPHPDDWFDPNNIVISLARKFYWDLGSKKSGIIEMQLRYRTMEEWISRMLADAAGEPQDVRLYIVNDDGEVIYPLKGEEQRAAAARFSEKLKESQAGKTITVMDSQTGERDILAHVHSEYTEWTIITAQSESLLLRPVRSFRHSMVAASVGLILVTLLVSFFVAQSMTKPIKALMRSIRSLNVENLLPMASRETNRGWNELQMLDDSFKKMCIRLQDLIEETIRSRSKETEAKMVAMQAQMNPHFLYNTISAIKIMAEEQGAAAIVRVCGDLSLMLRYVLSDSHKKVTIRDEIAYAESYLMLMKVRYEHLLQYRVEIAPALEDVHVPKLIVQPIIENTFKHGIHAQPPWTVDIKGNVENGRWLLTIRDTGSGFSESVLESWDRDGADPDTGGSGMGLRNTAERLRLFYGGEALFEIGNAPEGGACVRIGGPMDGSAAANQNGEGDVR